MEICVKKFLLFLYFFFSLDSVIYIDFTYVAASNTTTDDFTN